MGEAGDIVVEQGKDLGPRLTVKAILGQHPQTEFPVAPRVRTKTWLDAEEHEPGVAAKGVVAGSGDRAQISSPVASLHREVDLAQNGVEHQLVKVVSRANVPRQ